MEETQTDRAKIAAMRRRVARLPFPGIEGAYILISGSERPREPYHSGGTRVNSLMTFFYDAGEWAAEWEPQYGPIQVWHKAASGKPHHFYDFTDSDALNWSQLAVDDNELPRAFIDGDYRYIFTVLRQWAER